MNDYQCHWSPTKKETFPCSTCLKLASTSLLWLVPRRFIFFQATASHNVLTYKFTMNQLHVDFITKHFQGHYKVGQLKVGQVLQIGTGIIKRDNFYIKVGQ